MTFFKKTLRDVPLDHKTVLVRADYNVPLTSDGAISDDLRIQASLPTLRYLLRRGCKVVIISHLGRPDGCPNPKYSLQPVADRLALLLHKEVRLVNACTGDVAYQAVKAATPSTIVMFENLRFHPEEEANDEAFAKAIAKASRARYFVQDGFGVVHRAHASTEAITHYLPAVAGILLEHEYTVLSRSIESPRRPLVAVLGGAKVSDKIEVIERFVEKADVILIGGAMANTFLEYKGEFVGASLYESRKHATLDRIYAAARAKVGKSDVNEYLVIPDDVAVARSIAAVEKRRVVSVDAIAKDDRALDIGDKTIERYARIIEGARTVIWNGPVGYSELENFAHGSARIALALATNPEVTSVVGGGDTADFVLKWDGQGGKSFSHVSTGGGAGLDLMAGKKLPGIEALLDATR